MTAATNEIATLQETVIERGGKEFSLNEIVFDLDDPKHAARRTTRTSHFVEHLVECTKTESVRKGANWFVILESAIGAIRLISPNWDSAVNEVWDDIPEAQRKGYLASCHDQATMTCYRAIDELRAWAECRHRLEAAQLS